MTDTNEVVDVFLNANTCLCGKIIKKGKLRCNECEKNFKKLKKVSKEVFK